MLSILCKVIAVLTVDGIFFREVPPSSESETESERPPKLKEWVALVSRSETLLRKHLAF